MSAITDEQQLDAEAAFLVALAEHGISPDIGELLARGDGRGKVAPGGLRKAMRAALEAAERAAWRPIEEAPKDGTEFLSYEAREIAHLQVANPTRWLDPGPYSSENGKNAVGDRRFQWPTGFYWAGYNGFVGPVSPTRFRPLHSPPKPESK